MGHTMRTKTSSFGTSARLGHDASSFYKRNLYKESSPKPRLPKKSSAEIGIRGVKEKNPKEAQNKESLEKFDVIYQHDSRDMSHLPDDSIHLMITSPPYNVGKDYDADLSLSEYKDLLQGVIQESYRVLVEGGRACVNIANLGRSPYIPLHAYVIEIAQECGFFMRGEIIWDKGASAGTSCAWGSWQSASNPTLRDVHEYILVFCKGTFKRHPIKQNTIGRDDFIENTKSIWRFHAVSAKKIGHPAPFPIELPLRLIHLYSYEGDIVLDPFMGSGTTAKAAQETRRKYIGYEIEESYIKIAKKRLDRVRKK